MNILLIGPTRDEDLDGLVHIEEYRTIIERTVQDSTSPITVMTTLLDEILIDMTVDTLRMYDSRNGRELSAYDAIILRGRGIGRLIDVMGIMTLYAERHGIKMINEYSVIRNPSKLLQNAHFHFNSMNIPHTLYVNRGLFDNLDWANWQFPSVMKLVNGSLGNNNFIVNSWDEVREIYDRNHKNRFILQAFIPNDGDFRILLAGNDQLIFKRISTDGSHLNNTSHGGSAELVDTASIPTEVLNMARHISHQYGMTLSGVDVMQHKETGDYYFLEVNMQPQLSTGALLDEKQALLGGFVKRLANEG